MDMKRISIVLLVSLLSLTPLLHSCSSMLDVDSDRYTLEEDARLKSLTDTLYTMVGVFTKMEALAEQYVLLGELRGDLMVATENAPTDLQKLSYFDIDKDNAYASMNAFYAVINQCNYIIAYADTAYSEKSDHPYMRIYVAAKAIRAWTYMQMVQNFGTVPYSTEPVLSVAQTDKVFPEYGIEDLCRLLIADLLPLADKQTLNLGSFGGYNSSLGIFPVRLVLGDLYLLLNEWTEAATMYTRYLYDRNKTINPSYINTWSIENDMIDESSVYSSWYNSLTPTGGEMVNAFATYPSYGNIFKLIQWCDYDQLEASPAAIDNWMSATFYHDASSVKKGDLRILNSVSSLYWGPLLSSKLKNSKYDEALSAARPLIEKYSFVNILLTDKEDEQVLPIYRNSLVYLRLAEAINRSGYPQLAFGVMKYGISASTLQRAEIAAEIARRDSVPPAYFSYLASVRFSNNVGTRSRGCGSNITADTTYFIIPSADSLAQMGYKSGTYMDSVLFVEDELMRETAMEAAFEGNRYLDLLRVARRRNDPSYVAQRVASKYTDETKKASVLLKLMDPTNWYLPK